MLSMYLSNFKSIRQFRRLFRYWDGALLSADRTLVAINIAGYLALRYTTIMRGRDGSLCLLWINAALCPWANIENCGFTHAVARCYPSWRQRTWHLQSMTRTLLQKTTCHQFLYAVHHWTLAVHLPLAVTILLLVNYFRSVVRAFESTNSTMQNRLY